MKTHLAATLCVVAFLSACTTPQQTTAAISNVAITVSDAQAQLSAAINLAQITGGVVQQALTVADPALTAKLAAGNAAVNTLLAKAQAANAAGITDAAAIAALASQITQQVNALTAQAAPVVTVVPGAPPA